MDPHTAVASWANGAGTDTPDSDIVGREVLLGHGHVRNIELQIHRVVDQLRIELILTKRRNRDRGILNRGLDLGRGNDHLLQHA